MNKTLILSALALIVGGCISVKTESEIKPIHITMDVNLKVDKDLDKAFEGEKKASPKGDFKVWKDLVDRKVAGITNGALLEARPGASGDDRISIMEQNAKAMKRMNEVAKENGVSIESVMKRRVEKSRENIPVGCWYQLDDGTWVQK